MKTSIVIATSSNVYDNYNVVNTITPTTAHDNGMNVLGTWPAPDRKRARRGLFDVCRMLRGDIATGKTFAAVPAVVNAVTRGVKRGDVYFDGDNGASTGVLDVTLIDGKTHLYGWRCDYTPTTDDVTIAHTCDATTDNLAALDAANVEYIRCVDTLVWHGDTPDGVSTRGDLVVLAKRAAKHDTPTTDTPTDTANDTPTVTWSCALKYMDVLNAANVPFSVCGKRLIFDAVAVPDGVTAKRAKRAAKTDTPTVDTPTDATDTALTDTMSNIADNL